MFLFIEFVTLFKQLRGSKAQRLGRAVAQGGLCGPKSQVRVHKVGANTHPRRFTWLVTLVVRLLFTWVAMEAALAIAEGILQDPLKVELRSILHNVSTAGPHLALDDRIVLGGEVVSVLQEELVLAIFPFKPMRGFEAAPCDEKMVRVKIPGLGDRSIHTVPGVQIMCAGKPLFWDDMVYEFGANVAVTFRPEISDAMPWNFLHLFSGSFGGWSQAASFLQRADQGFSLGQEIFVDNDETVMQIWSAQAGCKHLRGPLAYDTKWSPASKIGILTSVGDWSLANVCRIQTNLCCTVSPPCQSWSKAGQRLGLQDSNGWAFIDAIKMITIVQPITIAAECSDEITEHPHFKILEALIHSLGFRRTWTQVRPCSVSLVMHMGSSGCAGSTHWIYIHSQGFSQNTMG